MPCSKNSKTFLLVKQNTISHEVLHGLENRGMFASTDILQHLMLLARVAARSLPAPSQGSVSPLFIVAF